VETDGIGAAGASRVRSRARLRTAKRAESGIKGERPEEARGEEGNAGVSREGYRDRSLQLAQNFLWFLLSEKIFHRRESRYNRYLPLNCVWSRDIMGRTSPGLPVA